MAITEKMHTCTVHTQSVMSLSYSTSLFSSYSVFLCSLRRRRFQCGMSWMSLAPRCSTLTSPAVAWPPFSTSRASCLTLSSGPCTTCRKEVNSDTHTHTCPQLIVLATAGLSNIWFYLKIRPDVHPDFSATNKSGSAEIITILAHHLDIISEENDCNVNVVLRTSLIS